MNMAVNTDYDDWLFICVDGVGIWRKWSGPWDQASAKEILESVKAAYPKRKFAVLPGRLIGARTWDERLKDFFHEESALVVQQEKAPWDE